MRIGKPTVHPTAFVAPTAQIHGDIRVAQRVVIMFGVVLRCETEWIEIGEESNIQDNAVFHTDDDFPVRLGRRVTIGHGGIVHGATIGDHCLVGIGAKALNGSIMGEGSWLAAGALLPEGRELEPWVLAAGIPAKPIREVRPEERVRASNGVEHYLQIGELYRGNLG